MSLELHYQAWHQVCLNPSFHILWRGEREMSAVRAGSAQSSPIWWQESLGMAVLPSPHPWSKANWDTILPAICCLWHLLGWRMAMEMSSVPPFVWQPVSLSSTTTGSCWFSSLLAFHFSTSRHAESDGEKCSSKPEGQAWVGVWECSLLLKICLFSFG